MQSAFTSAVLHHTISCFRCREHVFQRVISPTYCKFNKFPAKSHTRPPFLKIIKKKSRLYGQLSLSFPYYILLNITW